MATITVYANTSDGSIASNASSFESALAGSNLEVTGSSGWVFDPDTGAWSPGPSNYVLLGSRSSSGSGYTGGTTTTYTQVNVGYAPGPSVTYTPVTYTTTSPGSYYYYSSQEIWLGFFAFDTSAIPTEVPVSSAILSLYPYQLGAPTTFQARLHDWGTSVSTTDWLTPSQLATKTLLGTSAGGEWTTNAYASFSDIAFAPNVNRVGQTRVVITTQEIVAGTPAGSSAFQVYSSDYTGTTKDPRLVLGYGSIKKIGGVITVDAKKVGGTVLTTDKKVSGGLL